jgi:hypothetical protein
MLLCRVSGRLSRGINKDYATFVGESTTQEGTSNACNPIHRTNKPRVHWPLDQGHGVCDDNQSAREDPRAAHARDGPPDDQGDGVRRHPADETSQLEDGDGGEVDPFDGEVGVELAEEQLEGGRGQQVRRAIPADVWPATSAQARNETLGGLTRQAVELIGDVGDGGGDNGVVERHEEHR